jgi:hypothetical protein
MSYGALLGYSLMVMDVVQSLVAVTSIFGVRKIVRIWQSRCVEIERRRTPFRRVEVSCRVSTEGKVWW